MHEIRQLSRVMKCMNRWFLVGLGSALEWWKRFATSVREQEIVISKARRRNQRRLMGLAFCAWSHSMLDRRYAQRLLLRILGMLRMSRVRVVWSIWLRSVLRSRLIADVANTQRAACVMLGSNKVRHQERLDRYLRATIFHSWRYMAILKAVSKAGVTSSRGAARHILRILEREVLRLMRKGFDKLVQFTGINRVLEEAFEEQMRRRLERREKAVIAIDLLSVKLVRKFYVAWLDCHKHLRIRRKLQERVIKFRVNQRMAIIIIRWRDFLCATKRFKR